jgi:hypothetical protein
MKARYRTASNRVGPKTMKKGEDPADVRDLYQQLARVVEEECINCPVKALSGQRRCQRCRLKHNAKARAKTMARRTR